MLALAAACAAACRGRRAAGPPRIPGDRAPALVVEVFNATERSGVARAGTRVLRAAGIDVVAFGNSPSSVGVLDSTRIVVRRGGVAAGQAIRAALGIGTISLQPDSLLLLDASVYLGRDFFPGPDFHP